MKVFSFLIAAMLIISLTGCVTVKVSNKAQDGKPESVQNPDSQDDKSDGQAGQADIKPEGLDWTINVDDTISGRYELPTGGKTLKCDITLRLVAWKSGGDDVFGRYEGEAYILFKFDESGMSDADYLYIGGGAFNRKCEKLEFEVEAYDVEKLNSKTIPFADQVPVVPLRKFNAMASFISVWSTTLQMDQTVKSSSGDTLSSITGGSGESSSDNMGIDLLIDKGHVTVDIPTYRLNWNCGYFSGTVAGSPLGTAKREKLDMPDAGLESPGTADDWGQGEYVPFELPQNELDGKYIEKDPNGLSGYDLNGDGNVDMYIDENGGFKFDINFDGVFDDLDDAEAEWGMG